jgi:hypothetical protein
LCDGNSICKHGGTQHYKPNALAQQLQKSINQKVKIEVIKKKVIKSNFVIVYGNFIVTNDRFGQS